MKQRKYEEEYTSSDLACERRRCDIGLPGVEFKRQQAGKFNWEKIKITSREGEKSIGRPMGIYDTLNLPRMNELCEDDIEDAAEEISRELCSVFEANRISPERILVVGLGNPRLTPDAVGPRAAEAVNATLHIKDMSSGIFADSGFSEIAVITPGVTASSGLEAYDSVMGICTRINPDAVIAIDALAARSPSRLGSTIQLSDSGIFPGSGIGNRRTPINRTTVGVPVIAIGVPTVINTDIFAFGEEQNGSSDDRESMFVSPKEIDEITEASAKIISLGINQAFGIIT